MAFQILWKSKYFKNDNWVRFQEFLAIFSSKVKNERYFVLKFKRLGILDKSNMEIFAALCLPRPINNCEIEFDLLEMLGNYAYLEDVKDKDKKIIIKIIFHQLDKMIKKFPFQVTDKQKMFSLLRIYKKLVCDGLLFHCIFRRFIFMTSIKPHVEFYDDFRKMIAILL